MNNHLKIKLRYWFILLFGLGIFSLSQTDSVKSKTDSVEKICQPQCLVYYQDKMKTPGSGSTNNWFGAGSGGWGKDEKGNKFDSAHYADFLSKYKFKDGSYYQVNYFTPNQNNLGALSGASVIFTYQHDKFCGTWPCPASKGSESNQKGGFGHIAIINSASYDSKTNEWTFMLNHSNYDGKCSKSTNYVYKTKSLNNMIFYTFKKQAGGTGGKFCTVPVGSFCGEYYNGTNLSGNAVFTQNTSSINYNWGNSGPGNGLGNDNFSVRWQGSFWFEGGTYTFQTTSDDGIKLYVDNVHQVGEWKDQESTTRTKDVTLSSGNHTIKVEYYERGGGAVAQASWVKKQSTPNLAQGRSTWATSQESSSYPSSRAVDGNRGTRWSSRISSTLGEQWLTVDLGSTRSINQIVIRWEAAYARNYFVGYSTASNCSAATYSGWNYTATSREDKTISFGSVNARCVGILMRQRAPGMNNFSVYEVEVYKK